MIVDFAQDWKKRLRFDALLWVVIFIVMIDRLTTNLVHEVLGVVSLLAVLLHVWINKDHYAKPFGRLTGRIARRGKKKKFEGKFWFNVLLAVSFLAAWVSGLMCSQTLFSAVTPYAWQMDLFYREVHVTLSLWFFFLLAVHVGLHAEMFLAKYFDETNSKTRLWLHRVIAAAFVLLSVAMTVRAYELRDAVGLMQFAYAFIPVEPGEWAISMPLDLLFVAVSFATLPVLCKSVLKRCS